MSKSRLYLLIGLGSFMILFFTFQTFRWSGQEGAEKAHRKFIQFFSERRWGKCGRMISENYADQWNFNRENIALALQDFGRHFFISLEVSWETNSESKSEEKYKIIGSMKIEGLGDPGAEFVLKKANLYLIKPFTFHWTHSGLMPWSWELERIEHPTLQVPTGYSPRIRNPF